jgi:hypothetical protein
MCTLATHSKRRLFSPYPSSFRIPDAVLSQGTQTSGCVFCSACWVGCCSATRTSIGDARRKWNDRNRRDHLKNTAGAPSDKAEAYRRSVCEWQGQPACCDHSRNRHMLQVRVGDIILEVEGTASSAEFVDIYLRCNCRPSCCNRGRGALPNHRGCRNRCSPAGAAPVPSSNSMAADIHITAA